MVATEVASARRLVARLEGAIETMDPKSNSVQGEGVQGEGNYEATRRYNEGLKKSVDKGTAEELAEEAKKALEGREGEELREADEKGKQGGNKPVPK
jgi:hypothetical protein